MDRFDLYRAETENIDPPVILCENVTKDYVDGLHAIKNLSLQIRKGEFVFIVGSSGSGKSTLIKLLLREITPTSGLIMVAGRNIVRMRSRSVCKLRRSIGVVFQDFRLLKDRNVYDNVAFAQRVTQVPKKQIARDVPRILSIVGLADKYKSFPTSFRAVSSNVSHSQERSSTTPLCSSPTSPRVISTPRTPSRSCDSSRRSTDAVPPSSW